MDQSSQVCREGSLASVWLNQVSRFCPEESLGTVQLIVFETRNGSMKSLCLALSLVYVRFKPYVKDGSL